MNREFDGFIQIPVLTANAWSIAEAWEKSLLQLYEHGCEIKTEYDNPTDPPSKDATMILTIGDPMRDPMIHRDLPGGLEDLQEYVMEVCDGVKDHLVVDVNSDSPKWKYTYHQRFFNYNCLSFPSLIKDGDIIDINFTPINQFKLLTEKLAQNPHSRRAQMITWQVDCDNKYSAPPCIQSVWCRTINNHLCMNVRIRSNDAYKAAMMNLFAFSMLQKKIVDEVSKLSGKKLTVGRLCWMADSYHIYGKDMKEFEGRFLKAYKERPFENITFRYEDVKPIMDEAIPHILNKVKNIK